MKKNLLALLITVLFFSPLWRRGAGGEAFGQYDFQNIYLLSQWDTAHTVSEPIYNIRYSSPWGWADTVKHREYAILGSSDGTYFIDVTIPTAPVVRDFVAGPRDSCVWREYKTYQKYLYMVSDDEVNANNTNNMQIIDMSYLPDSVHLVFNIDTPVVRSHTLFIDGDKLYCGYDHYDRNNENHYYKMAVYSLADPTLPQFIQSLDSDFTLPNGSVVHDMYVRHDTVYASCSDAGLFIFKFSGGHFSLISSLTNYPDHGYNHSSALTADGKTLIFVDEVPAKLPCKSLDVSDLSNLTLLQEFKPTPSDTATPHNPFIREGDNSRVVVAYYQSGVQIFDIRDPANITRTGFFDTSPLNCPDCPGWGRQYSGCWGVYIDLPSGIVLASDMQNGLFVLDASAAMGVPTVNSNGFFADVLPNPSDADFTLLVSLTAGMKLNYSVMDVAGKLISNDERNFSPGKNYITLSGKNLSAGTYLLKLEGEGIFVTKKLIKTK